MGREADGTYNLPPGNPVVSGTQITITWANSTLSDLADSMTNSLARDGKGGMTAPLYYIAGTEGSPGASFNDDKNTGMFLKVEGELEFSATSSSQLRVTALGSYVRNAADDAWLKIVGEGDGNSVQKGTADFQTLSWEEGVGAWLTNDILQIDGINELVGIGIVPSVGHPFAVGGDSWIGSQDGLSGVQFSASATATLLIGGAIADPGNATTAIGIVGSAASGQPGVALQSADDSDIDIQSFGGDINLDHGTGGVLISNNTGDNIGISPEGWFQINTVEANARFAVSSEVGDTYAARIKTSTGAVMLSLTEAGNATLRGEVATVESTDSAAELDIRDGGQMVLSGASDSFSRLAFFTSGGITLGRTDVGVNGLSVGATGAVDIGVPVNENIDLTIPNGGTGLFRLRAGTTQGIEMDESGVVAFGKSADPSIFFDVKGKAGGILAVARFLTASDGVGIQMDATGQVRFPLTINNTTANPANVYMDPATGEIKLVS
jgi:hypothetical protein